MVLGALLLAGTLAAAAPLRIVTPAPDETVHDNRGTVPVVVTGAAPGVLLQPVLDGEPAPTRHRAPAFELHGVPRGSHQLRVRVVDAEGRTVAETATVRFHVFQASRLLPR